MAHRTATSRSTGHPGSGPIPLDVATMRATARRLVGEDADVPTPEELDTLTLTLRGHIMLTIPEVESAAWKLSEDDIPRACALACIGEARMKLGTEPRPGLPAGIAHAQRLARVLNALVDHSENLGGARA
ncbi:DUF6415 family natural product biosynthesis protein [Streptomyces sp. NPDC051214]|uniref:DUF6415 family natural product biosynthesis protein n=1 Tax=Streptomyces sp. NPDC051214 TaxID=3155282 RepID=UPI00344AF1FB